MRGSSISFNQHDFAPLQLQALLPISIQRFIRLHLISVFQKPRTERSQCGLTPTPCTHRSQRGRKFTLEKKSLSLLPEFKCVDFFSPIFLREINSPAAPSHSHAVKLAVSDDLKPSSSQVSSPGTHRRQQKANPAPPPPASKKRPLLLNGRMHGCYVRPRHPRPQTNALRPSVTQR